MKAIHLLITLFLLLTASTAWADVEINEENFPDENFRNWVLSQSYGTDGVLTAEEIAGVKGINVKFESIQSLKGIEFFTALTYLYCNWNQLTALDVSKNTALTSLECTYNQLTALDVSWCTDLTRLYCNNNQLTTLDVSHNTKLTWLDCSDNQMTTLDVSHNTKLTNLWCYQNQIKGTGMDALVKSLPSVSNGELRVIYNANANVMTTSQVTAAKAKGWIPQYCDGYNWQEYAGRELDNRVAIEEENFPDGNLRNFLQTELHDNNWQSIGADGWLTDEEIARVTVISIYNQNIQSLKGIEHFTALTSLSCESNQLTTLDVSKNIALEYLNCNNNQLTTLDVSKNTVLEHLYCNNNQLTTLDVSGCTALKMLECRDNQLAVLDVSNNTVLKSLLCDNNQLEALNVSKNTALDLLRCGGNRLTALDASKNHKLTQLGCDNNQLTMLDVSGCTAMQMMDCSRNLLRGAVMDALVKGLPRVSSCTMYVIYNKNEQNVMTTTQVAAAKAKGWSPRYFNGSRWSGYAGSEPVSDGIAINTENFPDEKFRNYLLSQTYGTDGVLTEEEIAGVTNINVGNKNIQSLKGIEYFTALTSLFCSNNLLTMLDVSKNTALTELYCKGNQLTQLDVSNNTALTYLYCEDNLLTTLDVSKNTALKWLYCYQNQIKGVGMDALVDSLPAVDIGHMYVLYYEDEQNVMTTVQAAAAKAKGWTPYCLNNDWEEYVGSEPVKEELAINAENFPDENFRNYLLSQSYGTDGVLTEEEIAGVTYINVRSRNIQSLKGIDYFIALTELSCHSNQLTELNLSKNTELVYLNCYNNKLNSLDLSNNTKLIRVGCYQNQIKGAAMDAFVESLPTVTEGNLKVIHDEDEQNEMTTTQVAVAKAKGWIPACFDGWMWQEYAGSKDPDGIKNIEHSPLNIEHSAEGLYDLSGRKLDKPQKGINIIRMSDGTIRKVLMK